MTNTMLNEGEAVSRGAMGRQRNPNFSLPIDGAQAQQLMQDLGDQPSMLDESRLDLLEGYAGEVRNQKARDMRSMYTDPVTWWKGEGNDNVADEVKHEIANRRFIANAFGQTTDQQGDLYPSFRDRYFDQTFGKMPANESEAFTMLQKGVTAQQQTEQAIKELPSTLALNLMRAAAGGTEVSEAASYDIYQSWKDRHAEVLSALPEDWESKAMEQAESLRSEMDTMMRDIAPEAKKVWDILQKWTRPEKTYTGDKPPQGQGRGPSQQDTSVENDTPVSREDIEGVAKALTEMPEEKQKRLLEMLYMSAEATGAGMGRGFFEKIGEGLARGGVRIYEEGVMASEDRTARYNLTRLKRGETLYEMADGVVGTKEEIARLASSGNYNATKLLTDPRFQAGTGNVNDERRSQLLDANEQRVRELSTLRKIRSLASGGIDPLKTEMTGVAGSVIQGAYDYSQSAAYSVMAAVPFVGFPAVAVSLANTNYFRMLDEYPDIDPDFAWNASLAIGAPQAFVERLKVNALLGRSPMLNKLMKRMTDARVPLGVRIGLAYGANVAYQTGQEFLQEAMPTVADQLSAALREDMPEFDANQAWGAYVDQMPQIFYSMLWAGLIGTGVVSLREFKRDGIFLTNVGELEMVGIVGDTARDIAAEQDTDARNEKIKTAWGQRNEADIKAGIAKRAAMLQAANVNDTRAGMPQRDSVELQDGTVQHTIRDSEGNVLLKTTDPLAADVAYIGMVRQITSKEFNNETVQLKGLTEWWLTADPTRADNEQRQLRDTDQGTAQQKLEALQQANSEQGIAELHRRIAQSPYAGTPYDQIQILGEASVEQVGDMVFRSVIALNKNSRVRDAREEMHHTAVRMAVANGKVDEQTMRGWLEATERVFAEKGLNTPLPRADMTDIVESMAVVQEAFENERISADVEMSLPQAFVDYIKRMIQVFVEVLKRGKAIREALDAGVLPAEFEGFLAMTTGVSQQEIVDRARERTEQEVRAPAVANYSIGALGDENPFIHPRGADGKYKGAPKWVNAPKTRRGKDEAYMRLRERLYQLVQEGAAGRFWYEDSGRAVLRMFNNNVVEAEKFIELLAIYSPQATVEVNTYFALRAYIQRAVNAAKEDFAVKTGAQDDKAKSVLYDNQPWAGRKTDNFYKNIMYVLLKELPASEVAKLKLDAEVYEMLQKPVTVDMWVYRAFGFDSDALTDVAGTGAFGFAERELNLIAEELNASLPEGVPPYLPHQIQAMLWTSIKGRSETKEVKDLTEAQSMKAKDMVKVKNAQGKLVREFKDKEAQKRHMQRWITNALALPAEKLDVGMAAGAFDRFINSVSMRALWESVPSTNTPEGVAITNLPTAQKAAFTRASRDIILDENGNDMLAAMLGVPVNVSQLLSGGYGTGATPNVVTELFPNKPSGTYDDDVVRAYARAIQYIYRQDAVPWMRYIKFGAQTENSYYAQSPKGSKRTFRTQAEAQAFIQDKIAAATTTLEAAQKRYAEADSKPETKEKKERMERAQASLDKARAGLEEAKGYTVRGEAENFALMLDFGEQLAPEFLDQLQQGLVKVHESLGFTQVSPTEVIVTNFRDSDTGLPALTDEAFYESLTSAYGEQANIQRLHTVGEYGPVHDWSQESSGASILSASSRLTPDLLEWIRGRRAVSDALQKNWAEGRGVVSNYSIGSAGVTLAEQLKELQAGESAPVDTDKTFWLIASSSGDIVDILDNEQDATIYFQTTASTGEWLWEYKDGLRTKVPLLKRGVAERRADGYIDTVRQEQENAGRVFYDGADTSAETTTSAGEIPSYTPDGRPWAGQEESVVYHGGRLFDPQGTDQGGYGETQTLKPRRPYQTYLYSISTQSEIDRVQKAMGALDRSPLDTLEITEKLRKRFASIMAENMVELAAMRQGGVAEREVLDEEGNPIGPQPDAPRTKASGAEIRRTKLLQALGELDGLLSALPPQVAAKVGGYTVLANIGTGDRALSNFFIKRLEMIDKELERYLKDRYTKALDELFKRAKPKQDAAGKVPQGKLGASVHDLFDELRKATTKTVVEVDGEVTSLEQQVASGELEPDMEAMKGLLADVLPLFANWATADASRMAQAVQIGFDILRKAYKRQRELTQIKRNQQEERRLVAKESTGITGDIDEAINKQQNIAGKRWQQWKALNVNLFGFDQLISFVFGRDSKITKEIVNAQRKADNVKADELIGVWEEWQGVLAELAGVEDSRSMKATHKGQDIVYRLAEPKTAKIKHANMQGEEIELEFSQNQLITITMMWMQPKGRAHMMGKLDSDGNPIGDWHYDQDFVNRVEAKMTPEARAIRRFLLRKYAEEWSSINEVFVRLRGINMPQEDFYSPLGVDPLVAIDSGMLADPATGFALSAPNRTPPALRSRGAAVAKPKFQDAVQVYFAHRKQMAHWKAYAEFNSDMLSVLGHRNTRNAVEAKGGVEALKTLNKWLTYMTQGGNIDAAAGLAMNEYFNGVMGRIASFVLFGKVVTVAIQSTQLGAAAAKMPFPSYINRLAKLLTGQMSWGDSLRSPYIQRRIKEMPPQVQLAMEGLLANKPSYVAEAARRVGWYISGSDGLYTAGTYAMIYDYRLEQAKKAGLSGPEAERVAREEAERDTDEVAQPTRMGARSAFEATMTSPLARSAWAFGSDARKNWAMNSFLWFSNASADRKRQALYFTLVISTAMATVIRTIARDIKDDDDEEWFDEKNWDVRRMTLMMATDFVYGFPVLGEMAEETAFRLFGEYRPQGSVLSVGDSPAALSRMPQHIADTLNGEADPDKIVKDVNRMLQGMGLFSPQAASAAALSNAAKDLYEFTKPLWKDDE